jgi:hypothetical protein
MDKGHCSQHAAPKMVKTQSCTLQGFRRRHAAAIHDQVDSLGELRVVAQRPDHAGIRRA